MKSFRSLCLVGSGPWSSKIKASLEVAFDSSQIKVQILSAREVLQNPRQIETADIIWYSTWPSTQVRLASHSGNTSRTQILEKPYGLSAKEIQSLIRLDLVNHKLFLSQVWSYSTLWREAKKVLLSERIVGIKGERIGPSNRQYIPASLDWASHDLYLLADLADSGQPIVNGIHISHEASGDILRNFDQTLSINVGNAAFKSCYWEITTAARHLLKIDFLRNLLILDGKSLYLSINESSPIVSFFESTQNASQRSGRNQTILGIFLNCLKGSKDHVTTR